jgi:hypothetical protein
MLGKLIRNIRAKDKQTRDFYALISALLFTVMIVVLLVPGYFGESSKILEDEVNSSDTVGFGSFFSRLRNEFNQVIVENQNTSTEPQLEASEADDNFEMNTENTESVAGNNYSDMSSTTASSSSSVSRDSKKARTVRLATTSSSSNDQED